MPKLVTVLREGYSLTHLRADAIAGLTVAIVALPLSMAIAIAAGLPPELGLYTAIVGGFLVSLLGGSRFQIGGPAGAFIVLVAATVQQHGLDGLVLATFLSGLMLVVVGALGLGTFIKYTPLPVTVGFTAGIALIIFASQLKELLGLQLAVPEPAEVVPKLGVLAQALASANPAALGIAIGAVALIVGVRKLRPHWPAFLVAVAVAAIAAAALGLPVDTIQSRFGGIPTSIPTPRLPTFALEAVVEVMPAALAFTLLGAIESLLSAVVADSMTGRRHRSNAELVGQGIANVGSSLFGGFCVTGTIARTATNVRAGARGPVAGMLHSVILLAFMLVAAPLAGFIPLPALAGVLVVVAWNMAEKHEFVTLLRASKGDAFVLLTTFVLVIFQGLAEGIAIGFIAGALLFIHRMAQAVEVEHPDQATGADVADSVREHGRTAYDPSAAIESGTVVLRISGAFFFAAASSVAAALDRIGERPQRYVLDFSAVPYIDSTAAASIAGFVRKAAGRHAGTHIVGASPAVRRVLVTHGVRAPQALFHSTMDDFHASTGADATAAQAPA